MLKTETMDAAPQNDSDLVAESLAGNKDAFRQIVERYQTLICSLAYCATGSVSQSEDLAQETFVTAWKHLAALREPARLRSWLCAIVRSRIGKQFRQRDRDPIHSAEPLEVVDSFAPPESSPHSQAITNEETIILWRSLERIPEMYREPLVLFYREHQSIETVAANLDLTEDAVKQRLSRGRKMLQRQVLAFVEGALEKTSPGKTFTLGVIAILPAVVTSAKAATVSATVFKGAPAAHVVSVGSLGALLAMLGSAYISLRAEGDNSKSPRERQFVLQMFGMRITFILLSFALVYAATKLAFFRVPIHFDYLAAALFFCFCFDVACLSNCQSYRRQQIQIEDNTYVDAEWRTPGRFTNSVRPQFVRLAAFGVISGSMVGVVLGGNVLASACIGTALVALLQIVGFVRRHHIPRFQPLHWGRGSLVVTILAGFGTLLFIYRRLYVEHTLARTVGNTFNRESPTEILFFDLIVLLAYAGFFIALLAWKRKRAGACPTISQS